MAIFSRRALQRILLENAVFLTVTQLSRHVSILNDPEEKRPLATEWEVVVLNALSKLGTVAHEPPLPSRRKVDALFTPARTAQPVAIEIATVSDAGLHRRNPYDALSVELVRKVRKLREQGVKGSFNLEVGASPRHLYRGSEPVELKLPPQGKFAELIFNAAFKKYLAQVASSPGHQHVHPVRTHGLDIKISYDPQGLFFSGGHLSYTQAHSKKRNPVAQALNQKRVQLRDVRDSGFGGPFGIVLCNGECEMMGPPRPHWSSYTADEVIEDFLRQHTWLSFVLTLSVNHDGAFNVGPNHLAIDSCVYHQPPVDRIGPNLLGCLGKLRSMLPRPMKTASNAHGHLDWVRKTGRWNTGRDFYGGSTVTNRTIKLSARTLLELLAGRLDQHAFSRAHGFDQHNPFLKKLEEGRLISGAQIIGPDTPEDDDDWIVFNFGEADAAVSPFRVLG